MPVVRKRTAHMDLSEELARDQKAASRRAQAEQATGFSSVAAARYHELMPTQYHARVPVNVGVPWDVPLPVQTAQGGLAYSHARIDHEEALDKVKAERYARGSM